MVIKLGAIAVLILLGDQAAVSIVDIVHQTPAQWVKPIQQAVFLVVTVSAFGSFTIGGGDQVAGRTVAVAHHHLAVRVGDGDNAALGVAGKQHAFATRVHNAMIRIRQRVAVRGVHLGDTERLIQRVHITGAGGQGVTARVQRHLRLSRVGEPVADQSAAGTFAGQCR